MEKNIEKAVTFMENIARDNRHGYDQVKRNGPDYDCSSLLAIALNHAGFQVSQSSTTRNLYHQLIREGFEVVQGERKRGDIFLKVGHHVVMCTNSKDIVHASINEKGQTIGGKSGDQTGKEICIRTFYNYKNGWDYHLRYAQKTNKVSQDVKLLQHAINWDFKPCPQLQEDNICGVKTRAMMKKIIIKKPKNGACKKYPWITRFIQKKVNVKIDGYYGQETKKAVQAYQKKYKLMTDGIVGYHTLMQMIK